MKYHLKQIREEHQSKWMLNGNIFRVTKFKKKNCKILTNAFQFEKSRQLSIKEEKTDCVFSAVHNDKCCISYTG